MKIREIRANSIITKSNLPDSDYVINPYVGCTHSCTYCYARFMKRFTGHSEKWGSFVDVKINAPDLVPQSTKFKDKSIFLSSVTDPYLPLEKKYQITRRVLENLIALQPNIGILTKSELVTRDIDILRQFKNCEVGLTITALNDEIRKEIEPFASPVQKRIDALKQLKKAGLKTYIFIGPILPFLTDWKKIISETKKYADFYMLENLNISGSIWKDVETWLKQKHPELTESYEKVYSNPEYWSNVEKEIRQFCKEQKIECRLYFHHAK